MHICNIGIDSVFHFCRLSVYESSQFWLFTEKFFEFGQFLWIWAISKNLSTALRPLQDWKMVSPIHPSTMKTTDHVRDIAALPRMPASPAACFPYPVCELWRLSPVLHWTMYWPQQIYTSQRQPQSPSLLGYRRRVPITFTESPFLL